MKCAKCNSEVSIADSKCPKCGQDLLRFGSTAFYEPKGKNSQRYGQGVKDMVFGASGREIKDELESLSRDERKLLSPVENRLKGLFARHLSDEEFDEVFTREVVPTLRDLERDRNSSASLRKIEKTIRSMIGDSIFQFYERPEVRIEYEYKGKMKVTKGTDILDILRAGEIIFDHITNAYAGLTDIDFSACMFSYFKASEVGCLLHTYDRYADLRNSDEIEKFVKWLGNDLDAVYIEKIPSWLGNRKKTLFETVHGIYRGKGDHINGSLRTGIAIYVFGRNWTIELTRKGASQTETYQLKNHLNALGRNEEKEILAENLSKLQALRNQKVHSELEKDRSKITESRTLSYHCLKGIYGSLEI
jgi:hypothetical protein